MRDQTMEQRPPNVDAGKDGDEEEPQTEDEDEDDDMGMPPPEFHQTVSELLPRTSKRDIYSAWDKTRGVGAGGEKGKYDAGSARVQAALGILFDLSAQQPSEKMREKRVHREDQEPTFLPSSPSTPPSHPKSAAKSVQTSTDISKGKKKATFIEISDSDSNSDSEAAPPKAKKVKLDKGKGKAREIEVLDLGDDEEEIKGGGQYPADWDDSIEIIPSPLSRTTSTETPLRPRSSLIIPPILAPTPENLLLQICPLFPDCQPDHILDLLNQQKFKTEEGLSNPDMVVDWLFGDGKDYPKIELEKGKGKAAEGSAAKPKEIDWLDVKGREAGDGDYRLAALHQLYIDFDFHPAPIIKNILKANGSFYAPSYLALKDPSLTFDPLAKARITKAKRKKVVDSVTGVETFEEVEEAKSAELEMEKAWLRERIVRERKEKQAEKRARLRELEDKKKGLLIECGCCFADYCFDDMVQCAEAHLFCRECVTNNVNNQIGERKFNLPCMCIDGCDAEFLLKDIEKFLPETSVAALHKIKQEKEVQLAGIEGLACCPYCPFAYVIDNPNEKLFHCQRLGCEKSSCRSCKGDPHIPLTCEEAKKAKEHDDKLGSIHRVEEAMTLALIRTCPKCQEPYVKSDGCNYITCSNCKTGSCFVCGKRATHGPPHFDSGVGDPNAAPGTGKCKMFDDSEVRVYNEVEAARKAALEKVAAENPKVGEDDVAKLRVDKPVRGAPNHARGYYHPLHHYPIVQQPPPPPPIPDLFQQFYQGIAHFQEAYAYQAPVPGPPPAPVPQRRAGYLAQLAGFRALGEGGLALNAPHGQRGGLYGNINAHVENAQAGPAPLTPAQVRARAAEAAQKRARGG